MTPTTVRTAGFASMVTPTLLRDPVIGQPVRCRAPLAVLPGGQLG